MDIYYTSFGIERQIEYIQSTTDLAFDQGIFEEKNKVGREFLFQNNPTASRVELTSGFPRIRETRSLLLWIHFTTAKKEIAA